MNLESTCAIFNLYLQLAVFNLITSVSQLFQQMLFYKNTYTLYFFARVILYNIFLFWLIYGGLGFGGFS